LTATEFHTESISPITIDRNTKEFSRDWFDRDKSQASILSLLLGLHLRGWLTAGDRRLLDLLVFPPSRTFLLLGERYLHPEQAGNLPSNPMPTGPAIGTKAFFTHRWQPDQSDGTGARRLHTAGIGCLGEQNLVLGVIEPEPAMGPQEPEDRFGKLVAQFRQALIEAAVIAHSLRDSLTKIEPWMLVNRASGRVIAAAHETCELLGRDDRSIIDQEYSSLSPLLSRSITGRGLHLENLVVQDMHLARITILPEQPNKPGIPGTKDLFFSEFIIHDMRNKLSAITTASSHLETLAREGDQSDERELAAIIQDQAAELDRQIERFQLLIDYDQLPHKSTSISREIANAVSQIEDHYGISIEVRPPADKTDKTIKAPVRALAVLLNAVLRSHRDRARSSGTTSITLSEKPKAIEIHLSSSFTIDHRAAQFSRLWKSFSSRLAETMGYTCRHQKQNGTCLSTTITISKNRK